ncbi:MAG: carboxypeptidase M32 [Solirubrobacteraceae bacterium]
MAAPPELGALREHLAELTDLHGAMAVLSWDQNTYMPAGGHATRAEQLGTLEKLAHARLVDSAVGDLLDVLEPWAAGEDPDGDDARLVRWTRRDHEKALRVPQALAVAMARDAAHGYAAWLAARETGEFRRFRDSLARQVELRREYAACFPEAAHPYDVLLDDFEPGMTLAEVRPLFDALVPALQPLVEAVAATDVPDVLHGDFPRPAQRALLAAVLAEVGFEADTWRLDDAPHPFAQSPGPGDVRITTRYRDDDLGFSLYSGLHEFGHGLYEANLGAPLRRTPLHGCASLGVHESQSRLWENVVGRGRPFSAWLLARLREHLPEAYGATEHATLYRGLNGVRRTLIRTEADETTYNLHVALRLDLELALIEDRLQADDLPGAWAEGMDRLLGVDVPSDAEGVLQDVHWAIGSFGYFPTYTLGNLMAAQLWSQAREELGELDAQIERGDFAPLREWLREHVHRHGRKYTQRELLRRATGQELGVEPFLAYLEAKLADAGVLVSAA